MNAIELFKEEAQNTLDIPYRSVLTRSTVGLIADENSQIPISWEKDLLTGEVMFYMREEDEVYMGKGEDCRSAFANKQKL